MNDNAIFFILDKFFEFIELIDYMWFEEKKKEVEIELIHINNKCSKKFHN
mgnify:CR=1 FL=1|tara:strand:- start:1971 stop:2120 length:150 start_codon:yes stop_codon:yes gene_type:complete